MKYSSLGNKPNISESRFECSSSSFKLDSRGYPSVSYLENKQGHNDVNYVFWDGLQWSYNDIPLVYSSQQSIVYSPNSLILDSAENPVIAFSRKSSSGSRLFLTTYDGGWVFNTLDVDYEVGWIGVAKSGDISPSSSSSSSSSSSLISSSSSGSPYEYYVVTYDTTNKQFHIYSVSTSWSLIGSISYVLYSFDGIRVDGCGRRIGIAFIDEDIRYNFFDVDSMTWSFVSFDTVPSSLLYGPVSSFDFKGYSYGGQSLMALGWLSGDGSNSYVCSVLVNELGGETPSDGISAIIESKSIDVVASAGYTVNGFKTIGVSLDSVFFIHIFASGLKNKLFDLGISGWAGTDIEINGISEGIVLGQLGCEFYDTSKIVGIDAGNVYYFDYVVSVAPFTIASPDMVIASQGNTYRTVYTSGVLPSSDIDGIWNSFAIDVLKDSERPLLVVVNR